MTGKTGGTDGPGRGGGVAEGSQATSRNQRVARRPRSQPRRFLCVAAVESRGVPRNVHVSGTAVQAAERSLERGGERGRWGA